MRAYNADWPSKPMPGRSDSVRYPPSNLASSAKPPKSALGFDFDGARFTHVAGKVTFEVIAASFGLDDDAALRRLGEAVHYIDIGGAANDEAAGLEMVGRAEARPQQQPFDTDGAHRDQILR